VYLQSYLLLCFSGSSGAMTANLAALLAVWTAVALCNIRQMSANAIVPSKRVEHG